jgi:hypothetical protein
MRIKQIVIIMVTAFLAGGCVFGQGAFTDKDSLSIAAEDKKFLEIRTPQNLRCGIEIAARETDRITVEYYKWARAKSLAQEKRFSDLIDVQLDTRSRTPDGAFLRILTPTKAPWEGTDYSMGIELQIKVPVNFKIDSHNSYSDIKLWGPLKDAEIYNEYGTIEITDVNGSVIVKASYTPVELTQITGLVSVETRYGEIVGKDIAITGSQGSFETSYGAIELENIQGSVEARTSYEKITAKNIDAGSNCVILTTSYGPIDAEDISGELVCETSYHSVNLSNIDLTHGMNKIETKYAPVNIEIHRINASQLLINNAYSSINLLLQPDVSAKLMLTVDERGKIHTRGFSIKPLAIDKNRLIGIIGDGLARIELNVDGIGEINIDKQ